MFAERKRIKALDFGKVLEMTIVITAGQTFFAISTIGDFCIIIYFNIELYCQQGEKMIN